VAYGSAISACDRGGRGILALKLVEAMRRDGLEPGLVTYSIGLGVARQKLRTIGVDFAIAKDKIVQRRGWAWKRDPKEAAAIAAGLPPLPPLPQKTATSSKPMKRRML